MVIEETEKVGVGLLLVTRSNTECSSALVASSRLDEVPTESNARGVKLKFMPAFGSNI